MAVLSTKAVRQRIAAAIEALPDYKESRVHVDLFGADPAQLSPQVFAVGLGTSDPHPDERRQNVAAGALSQSTVTVKVAYNLRGDSHVADADAALDGEDQVRIAVMTMARINLNVTWGGASRRVVGDGRFLIVTQTFQAIHRLALE